MSMQIRQAEVEDFVAIAALIAQLNVAPTCQCIHSGDEVEAIQNQMELWDTAGEFVYVVAEDENGRLLATMGGEFDEEMGRCWLWGPHFTIDNWEPATAELFASLQQALPEAITIYDCYLNEENQRGLDFYRSLGLVFRGQAHVYVATRPNRVEPVVNGSERITAVATPGMIALHDTIFPETYISGKNIMKKVDEQHQIYIELESDEVLGYIYAVVDDADENLGYIEFLGVTEQAREQGVGGKLLRTALAWLFSEKGVREVGLNVDDTNINARGLYEKVGFRLKYSGVNLRLTIS